MRVILVSLAIVVLGLLLGANVYNSIVDAPNWGADIPGSIQSARQYFARRTPGHFFRVVSPLGQVCTLAALIVCWRVPHVRLAAGVAFLAVVCGDALTFMYFYPRNAIMFNQPIDVPAITHAWAQWSAMNHVRSAIVGVALLAELRVLATLR